MDPRRNPIEISHRRFHPVRGRAVHRGVPLREMSRNLAASSLRWLHLGRWELLPLCLITISGAVAGSWGWAVF